MTNVLPSTRVLRPADQRSRSQRARARWRGAAYVPLAVGAAVVGRLPLALCAVGLVVLLVAYPARIWFARRRSTITLSTDGLIVRRLGAPMCIATEGEAVWIYRHVLMGVPGGPVQVWVGPTGSAVLLEAEWGVDLLGELAQQIGAEDRDTEHADVRVSGLVRLYPEAYPAWFAVPGVRWLADIEVQIWIVAVTVGVWKLLRV